MNVEFYIQNVFATNMQVKFDVFSNLTIIFEVLSNTDRQANPGRTVTVIKTGCYWVQRWQHYSHWF